MNLAFIANHYKTIFFYALSLKLEAKGHTVYWLSPSRRWTKWLIQERVSKDKIFDLPQYGNEWSRKGIEGLSGEDIEDLARMEQKSGWTINDLILMDRLLSKKNYEYALAYLAVSSKYTKEFLVNNQISAIFSEKTWAYELVTVQLCRELEIGNFDPQSLSIPDGRFAFFEGHLQAKVVQFNDVSKEDELAAADLLAHYAIKKPKPRYWYLNNKIPYFNFIWIFKFIKNLNYKISHIYEFDETMFTLGYLTSLRFQQAWNSLMIRLFKPFESFKGQNRKPFILYALHKQPEASIDVLGSFYSNQLEIIKSLSRLTPVTHDLYVKEHRNSIGDNSLQFYNSLKRIPSLRLIDPYIDSHDLIKKADLVVSVTGTIAYEAALYGIPSINLAKMYFGEITTANGLHLRKANFFKLISSKLTEKRKDPQQFLANLFANTFEGIISDPVSDPQCMLDDNLEKVVEAFCVWMGHLQETRN